MPPTYHATLSAFTAFLTCYIHTLLSLRRLYPPASFVRSRFHNTPVYQSRHPLVCEWIRDAVAAVREELLKGTAAKIAVAVYWAGDGLDEGESTGGKGNVKIMERFMLDVSTFPVVDKREREAEIAWEEDTRNPLSAGAASEDQRAPPGKPAKRKPLDADVDVNLSEQFRAALIALTSRCSQLAPLPAECSFNVTMELKDGVDVDPPIGHPQPWVPVQPSLQKTGRKGGARVAEGESHAAENKEGRDLGGAKVTPIRTVEAGVFKFETWVEEGKAKLDFAEKTQSSFASSNG